jgi:hypothetical protein
LSLSAAGITEATVGQPGAEWRDGTPPCGGGGAPAWQGVTCDAEGRVTELSLPGLNLSGVLPPGLAALRHLQLLNLSGNAFAGTLPAAWLEPAGFPALASADLSGNLLAGTLPFQLMGLASTAISLGGNDFEAGLPPRWASTSLRSLDLSTNRLSGLLPNAWGSQLPALADLRLNGNLMRGRWGCW